MTIAVPWSLGRFVTALTHPLTIARAYARQLMRRSAQR